MGGGNSNSLNSSSVSAERAAGAASYLPATSADNGSQTTSNTEDVISEQGVVNAQAWVDASNFEIDNSISELSEKTTLSQNSLSTTKDTSDEALTAQDAITASATLTDEWNLCGTCEWRIDSAGKLTIRPLGGTGTGTLDAWGSDGGWGYGSIDYDDYGMVALDAYDDDVENGVYAPWYTECQSIKSVVVEQGVYAKTCFMMFSGCTNLTSIDLSGLDTSDVTNMYSMFGGCFSLTNLDLSHLDTSNVTYMVYMFGGCSGLTSLDLSTFNTSKVTDPSSMFSGCSSLASVNFDGFDTSNVTDMRSMFSDCQSLASVDLSALNTSNVTDMGDMFSGCSSLASVNFDGFDTSKVTSMSRMFRNCTSFAAIDLSALNTSSVKYMTGMFEGCSSLRSVTLPAGSDYSKSSLYDIAWKDTEGTLYSTTSEMLAANESRQTGAMTYSSIASVGWLPSGTCEWQISDEGCLTVRPASGQETGMLGSWISLNGIPWHSVCESIKSVVFENGVSAQTCDRMFCGCNNLASIDLTNLDISSTKSKGSMFSGCQSLTSITIPTGSSYSYTSLSGAKIHDIAWKDTLGNVYESTYDMLEANASKGNTGDSMTYTSLASDGWLPSGTCEWQISDEGCLTMRPLSGRETGSLGWWYSYSDVPWCSKAESIKSVVIKPGVSAKTCYYMFDSCSNLISINLSSLDTSDVTTMYHMFGNCKSLTNLDLTGLNTSKVTNMCSMFYGCKNITTINLSDIDTGNVTQMSDMFEFCPSLTSLDLSSLNTSAVKYMNSMFSGCSSLKSIDLSGLDTSKVTSMSNMFSDCSSLTMIDLSGLDTSKVTNMRGMFGGCSSLVAIDLSDFNTSAVADMSWMFYGCSSLTSLDVSNFDTSKVTSMYYMFDDCSNVKTLDLSNFNTSSVTDMHNMFSSCTNLTSIDLSSFNTSKVTSMDYMFGWCSSLETIDISSFDTSAVTDMSCMFGGCSSLTTVDLTGLDTSLVTRMIYMFDGCSSLKTIYASDKFSTASVTSSNDMFKNCTALVGGNGTAFDSSRVDAAYAHIDGGEENPGYFTKKRAAWEGDVNSNEVLNCVDALIAYDIANGLYTNLENFADMKTRADVNGDGIVDSSDAFAILRASIYGW